MEPTWATLSQIMPESGKLRKSQSWAITELRGKLPDRRKQILESERVLEKISENKSDVESFLSFFAE
jgi:hypothetical protein